MCSRQVDHVCLDRSVPAHEWHFHESARRSAKLAIRSPSIICLAWSEGCPTWVYEHLTRFPSKWILASPQGSLANRRKTNFTPNVRKPSKHLYPGVACQALHSPFYSCEADPSCANRQDWRTELSVRVNSPPAIARVEAQRKESSRAKEHGSQPSGCSYRLDSSDAADLLEVHSQAWPGAGS